MTPREPAILLVTCCLEETRRDLARRTIDSVIASFPSWRLDHVTVFDNASTAMDTHELRSSFRNVVRADRNVGFWSAVDWWLSSLRERAPLYTYVIESDMIHVKDSSEALDNCVRFLDKHSEIGAVRLHEYSCAEPHLYDKDDPRPSSFRALWQSHTNRVTGQPVRHHHVEGDIWRSNFLTQLPALNRYATMVECFNDLRRRASFIEPDFQALYHVRYPEISIKDGGIFHCNLNPYGTDTVTGSWTDPAALKRLGYKSTRCAAIEPHDRYTVTIVR